MVALAALLSQVAQQLVAIDALHGASALAYRLPGSLRIVALPGFVSLWRQSAAAPLDSVAAAADGAGSPFRPSMNS